MRKKAKEAGAAPAAGKNGAIIICNIIIALLCVLSIVTLYVGDFWNADIKLKVDKETLNAIMKSSEASGSTASNMAMDVKAAEENTEEMTLEDILKYIDDDFSLEFGMSVNLSGPTVVQGAFGNSEEAVKELISDQVGSLVDEISNSVDNVLKVSVKAVVKMAVEKAKEAIKEEMKKQMAEANITEEEMDAELRKNDTSLADINTMLDNFMENIGKMLEGDVESCRTFINEDATLNKVVKIICKDNLSKKGEYTEEELATEIANYKADLVKSYDDMISEFSIDGEFSSETIIISILNGTGLIKEEKGSSTAPANAAEGEGAEAETSSEKQFKNMDDVKTYVVEKLMSAMGEDAVNAVEKALSYVGYFLFFVMACWAYVLIKVIVKTIFAKKNKTVGLFFPRMFGWMPHVLFVGLPMTIINYLPKILEGANVEAGQTEYLTKILNMVTISVSSLTWISALCSVILLVMLFFYYPMRRRAKKNK